MPFFSMMELSEARSTVHQQTLIMYIFTASWKFVEQLFRSYGQSFGELDDILERNVSFSALNAADIIAVESRSFCKFLLRQAPFDAKRSQRVSEPRFHRLRGHLSSFRDDHYESTHDECYLLSWFHALGWSQ